MSCLTSRWRQYNSVPHSERQTTHSDQRHQQYRGVLGCAEGNVYVCVSLHVIDLNAGCRVTASLSDSVLQACKVEDLGKMEFDEEIKKRFKMVYVPNWFSVDLKTGVRHDRTVLKPLFSERFINRLSCD